ncbi:hypothetical protein SISSUDRAFT_983412 [Sistotremastrum suecicum HHB10207 ss-3]|uniref:Uncharacterized protein n=1 Tax=Sistotremastrum suecicum HHB10207 ss-3 TaxID=1314776 RepID=A0A166F8G6_9AGAM|nr:hypothetical protein SISSUDRAFT_983412 [Sistotremastrum suecicum HHB10207 ss-3]
MGQFFDSIPEDLILWIRKQEVFWVATAPLSPDGHVNVSSKGVKGTFHVVDGNRVWYQDLSGSGIETISHLRENGRITILFNAFEGGPKIARLFGKGVSYEFGTPEYDQYIPTSERLPGSRAVIVIDVHKVGTSCGWGVPLYKFVSHRPTLNSWASKFEAKDLAIPPPASPEELQNGGKIADRGMKRFWRLFNAQSIDGLDGLLVANVTPKRAESGDWKASSEKVDLKQLMGVHKEKQVNLKTARSVVDVGRMNLQLLIGILIGMMLHAFLARVGYFGLHVRQISNSFL